MTANHLLTGRPGVGKTTVIQRMADALKRFRLGGFYTEELRDARGRVGFRLVPVDGATPRVMAHVDLVSRHRVGRYGVDVDVIDYVVDTKLAPRSTAGIVLLDEIGKMECFSRRFVDATQRLLEDDRPLVATIAQKDSHPFIAEVKARADVQLLQVTLQSREVLPDELCARVAREVGRGEPGPR